MPLDDEDEEGENEEGKPKKKKPKKDNVGSKSKKQDPNAPPQNRYQGNDKFIKSSLVKPNLHLCSHGIFIILAIQSFSCKTSKRGHGTLGIEPSVIVNQVNLDFP